jgi:DNA repair exonuclease SbcCD ATPase subunit
MDKTVKIRAYAAGTESIAAAQATSTDDKSSLELAMKAQLEDERSRSLEHLKTIVQLRENLKLEQAKSAELANKIGELETRLQGSSAQETTELAKKSALLEEEKKRALEMMRMIEQLRENLKQEQAKAAESSKTNLQLEEEKKRSLDMLKMVEQLRESLKQEQAKSAEIASKAAAQETRAKELGDALGKISAIAAMVKAG